MVKGCSYEREQNENLLIKADYIVPLGQKNHVRICLSGNTFFLGISRTLANFIRKLRVLDCNEYDLELCFADRKRNNKETYLKREDNLLLGR